jgi:hypothetical protein
MGATGLNRAVNSGRDRRRGREEGDEVISQRAVVRH